MDRFLVALGLFALSLAVSLGSPLKVDGDLGLLSQPTAMCELTYKPCPGVPLKGKLEKAMFNGTCQGPIAILKKGTVVLIDFSFESDIDEAKLTSKVAGKIGVLPFVTFPLDNPDACKNSGLKCPIKAHLKQDYLPKLDVKNIFPDVNVIVKWELVDGAGNDVFCVTIPAKIVD